jgi:hypothetical protein
MISCKVTEYNNDAILHNDGGISSGHQVSQAKHQQG